MTLLDTEEMKWKKHVSHSKKTEVVAEAERQHWFRQQPMYARRFRRRDELDNPEWFQSSAKTETKNIVVTGDTDLRVSSGVGLFYGRRNS